MSYDITIIGAGPAGLNFANSIADTGLKILVIEKLTKKVIANPPYDGREIALTHSSYDILNTLGVLDRIPEGEISLIDEAKVLNGNSNYTLSFSTNTTSKDNLGFMISNQVIRKAAYASTHIYPNIHFLMNTEVVSIKTSQKNAEIKLSNGKVLTTSLIVASDSRFSTTRRMVGISTSMLDFGRTCIVCKMKIQTDHKKVAYESFFSKYTFAFLPLNKKEISVVITSNTNDVAEILRMNTTDFEKLVENHANGRFGAMHLSTKLFSYPLVATFAKRFYARRFALLGDAAVGMHPVTAHGYNLGLKGADILARTLKTTIRTGNDIGSEYALKAYSDRHIRNCFSIYHGTNLLVNLYTSNSKLADWLRPTMLRLANYITPAKNLIINHLTETATAK